jgi:vitamin B12 transporter
MNSRYFVLAGLLLPVPALAQGDEDAMCCVQPSATRVPDTLITVVALGAEQKAAETGQSVSVIGREEIEAVQGADIARVLERLPGVSLARNGSLGGFTGAFVRGANSQQLLVLVDGIRVADAASPGGGYDFGTLMTGPIAKIELLRGSNSVVWGSDAIGGVLAMTSREVDGFEGGFEYGARDTLNADASAGLQREAYGFTLSAGYTDTGGFSSAASGTERDGFRQWRIGTRGAFEVTERLSLVAAGRYADSRTEFDGFSFTFPFGLTDTPEFTDTEEFSARAGLEYRGDTIELSAGYSTYRIDRANYDPRFGAAPGFAAKGTQERAELKGAWSAAAGFRLLFGADHAWSRFATSFDARRTADTTSGHALIEWSNDRASAAGGLRIDDHSGFGSEISLGANGSFRIAGDWRIRASYGEGFKAPSLFQLHSDFGNPALQPERSRSYDIGVEMGERNGAYHAALTLFRRDTRNLIDFAFCISASLPSPLCSDGRFGFYDNIGKARAEGVELEFGARVAPTLRARAAYTYLNAKDRTPGGFNRGKELPRRPRHAATVSIDWETPLAGLKLGGDLRIAGRRYDDAGNFTRLGGYAVATLRASMPVTGRIELFGRVENIGDARYQTVAGYGTPGRSAYIGARARF